jgi:cardiolipin synthase
MTPRRLRWLANALTVVRLPLGAAVAATLAQPVIAAALVGVAAMTDALDGTVARAAQRRGDTSTAGDWLDPVADKLFVAIVAIALGVRTGAWSVIALIATRELLWAIALPMVWRRRGRLQLRAAALGKATTIAQLVAVIALIAAPELAMWPAGAAAGLGALAIADYARRAGRVAAPR